MSEHFTEEGDTGEENQLRDLETILQPAALSSRYAAFFLDYLLVVALIVLILTRILYPYFHPEFSNAVHEFLAAQQALPVETTLKEKFEMNLQFQMENEKAITDTQFIIIVIVWIYFALSEILMQGSTLGKKVFKLQTIDLRTMKRASGGALLVRNCLKTISITIIFPVLLIINLIIPFFSRFRLTGHDVLAKTMVTYDNQLEPDDPQKL